MILIRKNVSYKKELVTRCVKLTGTRPAKGHNMNESPLPGSPFEYDAKGRMTRQTTASGAQTDYAYDGATGNLQTVTAPANNDYGHPSRDDVRLRRRRPRQLVTDPNGKTTTYTYDALGRVLTVTLAEALDRLPPQLHDDVQLRQLRRRPRASSSRTSPTPTGSSRSSATTPFGRLVKSIDAANNTTTYAYTKDVLTSITDANGNVTSYQYDVLKRLTRTTFPDGAFETYTYWPDGLLAHEDRPQEPDDHLRLRRLQDG